MTLLYHGLFPAVWCAWVVYWLVLSRRNKVVVRREPLLSRVLHIGPLTIAALLLLAPHVPLPFLGERLWPIAAWPFWTGFAVTAGGLLFTVWARRHIGGNWSGVVTIKENHELVTTGPYAIVRHPIYAGLLLAFAGSAVARGEWRGILAFALVLAALYRKLRMEERWMREQFGDAYQMYCRRVAALVPFVC